MVTPLPRSKDLSWTISSWGSTFYMAKMISKYQQLFKGNEHFPTKKNEDMHVVAWADSMRS